MSIALENKNYKSYEIYSRRIDYKTIYLLTSEKKDSL